MPAGEVFVDSSVWVPLTIRGQTESEMRTHATVTSLARGMVDQGLRFVTTNLVVAETHQLLLIRDRRPAALQFLRGVAAPGLTVVTSDAELERRALSDWIEPYDDHDFSLCDAVSFAVMKDRGIRQALALDRHFAAAGFEVLPSR